MEISDFQDVVWREFPELSHCCLLGGELVADQNKMTAEWIDSKGLKTYRQHAPSPDMESEFKINT